MCRALNFKILQLIVYHIMELIFTSITAYKYSLTRYVNQNNIHFENTNEK